VDRLRLDCRRRVPLRRDAPPGRRARRHADPLAGHLDLALRNHTGTLHDDLYRALAVAQGWEPAPANIGLGFMLRGPGLHHSMFGTLASPQTYGNSGVGSTLFCVDPARDVTFVCLTAGVMEEAAHIQRFQRLSDLALAAAM
jgi:CubicO group peptidase (beta-lactamase class C family)